MGTPDYAEPILAWRAWHVVATACGLRLHSIGRPVVWHPGVEQRASCRRRSSWLRPARAEHSAPGQDCSCGVWAVQRPHQAVSALDIYGRSWKPVHRVLGRVSLWGTIVEHELGWRAEFAYPAELFIPSRRLYGPPVSGLEQLLESLSDYAVPVSILDAGARGPLARGLTAAVA